MTVMMLMVMMMMATLMAVCPGGVKGGCGIVLRV
jgi:hypothetical protein